MTLVRENQSEADVDKSRDKILIPGHQCHSVKRHVNKEQPVMSIFM